MNRAQKISLTLVITFSLGLFLGIAAIVMRRFDVSVWKIALAFAVAVAGSGGIISLIFFRKDKGAVTFDERDKLIQKNVELAGLGAVYLLAILVSYIPIAIAPEARIPTKWFPFLLPLAAFCQVFAQSIATLIQYGLKEKNNE